MYERFPIISVTAWEVDRSEPMGSKEKEWRFKPGGHDRWLFKLCRMLMPDDPTGEDWSEKIASEFAEVIGLPHATVELADRDELPGIISCDFVPDRRTHKLTHGNELMPLFIPDYPVLQKRHLSVHTVRNVLDAISKPFIRLPVGKYPPEVRQPTDLLVGYLMLDALIGNTDRHHENWAIVERQTGKDQPREAELAPTYDHASSLGRELTDKSRERGMAGDKPSASPAAYAARAKSAFYREVTDADCVSPLDAFLLAAAERNAAAAAWLNRLGACTDDLFKAILGSVPESRMSPAARRFTLALLQYNREHLTRSKP